MSGNDRDVEELTLRVGRFELTVRPLQLRPGKPKKASTSCQLLLLTLPLPLDELKVPSLPFLEPLARWLTDLTGSGGDWTATARVARAYRAGLGAKWHLAGLVQTPGLRNAYDIILSSPAHPDYTYVRVSLPAPAIGCRRGSAFS